MYPCNAQVRRLPPLQRNYCGCNIILRTGCPSCRRTSDLTFGGPRELNTGPLGSLLGALSMELIAFKSFIHAGNSQLFVAWILGLMATITVRSQITEAIERSHATA
jgi:hypothetical protein